MAGSQYLVINVDGWMIK